MEDSPQKIRHKEDSPHDECDREFESKRRQTFATVSMWKICHTTMIGWGRGGSAGLRLRRLRLGLGG